MAPFLGGGVLGFVGTVDLLMPLEGLGITVNLDNIPEFRELKAYVNHPSMWVRWFRRTFRQQKINRMIDEFQTAFLAEILNGGNENEPK
jgi:hypothetical protein